MELKINYDEMISANTISLMRVERDLNNLLRQRDEILAILAETGDEEQQAYLEETNLLIEERMEHIRILEEEELFLREMLELQLSQEE